MKPIVRPLLAAVLVLGLCACGNQPMKTSNFTLIQPLSQVEWTERIAANHAPEHVTNNSLIMMR